MQQRVLELIGEINGNPELTRGASKDAHLVNDLRIDSLNLVSLILRIEQEFDLEVDFDAFTADNVESLEAFTAFIQSQMSAKG